MKKGLKVIGILSLGAASFGVYSVYSSLKAEKKATDVSRKKFKQYYDMVSEWFKLYKNGKRIDEYFEKENIHSYAIYGAGTMGDLMYDIVEDKSRVRFFVEEKGEYMPAYIDEVPLYALEQGVSFDGLDAVVVSAVSYYEDIRKTLTDCGCTCRIISLEDIIFHL